MLTLTTTTGKETRTLAIQPLRTASLQAVAFGVRPNGLEEPLFVVHKNRERIIGGTRLGVHGNWIMAEYRLEGGTVVKFFVVRNETGVVKRCAGAYLVMDVAVPATILRVPGLQDGGGSNTFASIAGPFRIIPTSDFEAHGLKVQPHLVRHYLSPETDFEVLVDRSNTSHLIGARALDLS